MKPRYIKLEPHECALAHSALSYMVGFLDEDITNHGTMTKWARKEVRQQLISLRDKLAVPQ